MSALRILHVAPYCGDAWAYGGIPRLAKSLTIGLARQGHDVTFVTTDACDADSRLGPPGPTATSPTRCGSSWSATLDDVHLHVFPNLSNRAAYRLQLFLPRGLSDFMQRHARAFDVAHLHACRNLPGVIAARHLAHNGVPYVLHPNGTAPAIERRVLAKRVFDALLGDRVLRRASHVLAVSKAEERQLRTLGVPDDRVRAIPNPVDLHELAGGIARGQFRRTLTTTAGPLVLFLGKLTPRKRVSDLVRAFARLDAPDVRLVIAGNDMGAGASVRQLVGALGLAPRTVFTGLLRGAARLEALADADVLVYPSDHEIFGLVPLEALLVGTPVVVADDSGCAEVVQAVGGGLTIPVGDVDRLAAAVTEVLSAPDAWRARAAAAAVRVRERFGADRVCSMLSLLYAEMVRS